MPPALIRAVLVDLDGVIRLWDPGNDARAETAARLPSGAIRAAAFAPDLLRPAITGGVSDEQWRRQVADRLRAQYPGADAAEAVRLWSASSGQTDSAALDVIRACRRRAAVVLVTNATTRLARDLHSLGLDQAFDYVVNSAEIGCAKPDERIFEVALRHAGVSAPEALFVDDSAANVAAASGHGLHGHRYRGVDELRQTLHHHGLV